LEKFLSCKYPLPKVYISTALDKVKYWSLRSCICKLVKTLKIYFIKNQTLSTGVSGHNGSWNVGEVRGGLYREYRLQELLQPYQEFSSAYRSWLDTGEPYSAHLYNERVSILGTDEESIKGIDQENFFPFMKIMADVPGSSKKERDETARHFNQVAEEMLKTNVLLEGRCFLVPTQIAGDSVGFEVHSSESGEDLCEADLENILNFCSFLNEEKKFRVALDVNPQECIEEGSENEEWNFLYSRKPIDEEVSISATEIYSNGLSEVLRPRGGDTDNNVRLTCSAKTFLESKNVSSKNLKDDEGAEILGLDHEYKRIDELNENQEKFFDHFKNEFLEGKTEFERETIPDSMLIAVDIPDLEAGELTSSSAQAKLDRATEIAAELSQTCGVEVNVTSDLSDPKSIIVLSMATSEDREVVRVLNEYRNDMEIKWRAALGLADRYRLPGLRDVVLSPVWNIMTKVKETDLAEKEVDSGGVIVAPGYTPPIDMEGTWVYKGVFVPGEINDTPIYPEEDDTYENAKRFIDRNIDYIFDLISMLSEYPEYYEDYRNGNFWFLENRLREFVAESVFKGELGEMMSAGATTSGERVGIQVSLLEQGGGFTEQEIDTLAFLQEVFPVGVSREFLDSICEVGNMEDFLQRLEMRGYVRREGGLFRLNRAYMGALRDLPIGDLANSLYQSFVHNKLEEDNLEVAQMYEFISKNASDNVVEVDERQRLAMRARSIYLEHVIKDYLRGEISPGIIEKITPDEFQEGQSRFEASVVALYWKIEKGDLDTDSKRYLISQIKNKPNWLESSLSKLSIAEMLARIANQELISGQDTEMLDAYSQVCQSLESQDQPDLSDQLNILNEAVWLFQIWRNGRINERLEGIGDDIKYHLYLLDNRIKSYSDQEEFLIRAREIFELSQEIIYYRAFGGSLLAPGSDPVNNLYYRTSNALTRARVALNFVGAIFNPQKPQRALDLAQQGVIDAISSGSNVAIWTAVNNLTAVISYSSSDSLSLSLDLSILVDRFYRFIESNPGNYQDQMQNLFSNVLRIGDSVLSDLNRDWVEVGPQIFQNQERVLGMIIEDFLGPVNSQNLRGIIASAQSFEDFIGKLNNANIIHSSNNALRIFFDIYKSFS
jgi:hypothetical protein